MHFFPFFTPLYPLKLPFFSISATPNTLFAPFIPLFPSPSLHQFILYFFYHFHKLLLILHHHRADYVHAYLIIIMTRYNNFSLPPLSSVTINLIIINVIIWAVEMIMPAFGRIMIKYGGLHLIGAQDFNPLQFVTYAFLHDNTTILHIFFNMFTLWMFGRTLERVWGAKRFLLFYFVCAIGAAVVQEAIWLLTWHNDFLEALARINYTSVDAIKQDVYAALANHDPALTTSMMQFKSSLVTIGASGAIFGLLLGFAFVFPNIPLYLFFIPVPIKAKYMVLGYAVLEFFFGVNGNFGTVAHFAHLGGMLFGLILLLYWKKNGTLHGNQFY